LVIGLTGESSGSLLTPLLILLARMSPAEAVGTSLAFGFATKLYGSFSFFKQGLMRVDLVKRRHGWALMGGFIIHYLGLAPCLQSRHLNSVLLLAERVGTNNWALSSTSISFLLPARKFRDRPEFPHRLPKSNANDALCARLLGYRYHAAALFFVARRIQQ
jgi:uncharacterized membrane protein YfcA